jgi:penicillin-binding protein 1A
VPSLKTDAPAAIGTVFAEVRRIGGDGFGLEDLFQGRISIQTTVDSRVQRIVNTALESGLAAYEQRHPRARGVVQGAVVVLRNADAGILAIAGGRQVYQGRHGLYPDFNRATDALRQPGSAWKPVVYLAAFRQGVELDTPLPDEPIGVPGGSDGVTKWIANYDGEYKGRIPARQALAESRNTVAVWLARTVGIDRVIAVARELGIRSPVHPFLSTALGSSEVRLLELAGAYRAMASGIVAQPHAVVNVTGADGEQLYRAPAPTNALDGYGLRQIQEGLRGVVRIPGGTANALDRRDFPIPVMGKTGTTSNNRDALFVGSTYGPDGITVAVWIGFDDNSPLGRGETGGRTALPVFREILLQVYRDELVGPVPGFPWHIEQGITGYLQGPLPDTRLTDSLPSSGQP